MVVSLPQNVAVWIRSHLPLPDPGAVRFHLCKRIPFWWLQPHRRFIGLPLWHRVYLVETAWRGERMDRAGIELVLHELVHVIQFRRNPITFPLRYLINHVRYGYDRNPAEVEARETAARLSAVYFL